MNKKHIESPTYISGYKMHRIIVHCPVSRAVASLAIEDSYTFEHLLIWQPAKKDTMLCFGAHCRDLVFGAWPRGSWPDPIVLPGQGRIHTIINTAIRFSFFSRGTHSSVDGHINARKAGKSRAIIQGGRT